MTIFTFANNVNTTLAGAVSTSATTITLASTANLPASITTGEALAITLNDAATRQNFEVVYATARTGATLTVLRAQEGTAALAWLVGDFAYSPPTAGQQESFGQLAAANTWTGTNTFGGSVIVPTATLTDEAVNASNFPSLLNSTGGYKKYPDPNSPTGYSIEQWGEATTLNDVTVTFPIAFPNTCLNVVVCEANALSGTWGSGQPTVHGVSTVSPGGFVHWTLQWSGSSWVSTNNSCYWRAIGY
jgi:hypothetical protein